MLCLTALALSPGLPLTSMSEWLSVPHYWILNLDRVTGAMFSR